MEESHTGEQTSQVSATEMGWARRSKDPSSRIARTRVWTMESSLAGREEEREGRLTFWRARWGHRHRGRGPHPCRAELWRGSLVGPPGQPQVLPRCKKIGIYVKISDFSDDFQFRAKTGDVGLPFGCPTVTYQVHAQVQGGLVSPRESLWRL